MLHIIDHRSEYAGVSIVGLHYFSGTQKRKPAAIEKELNYLMAFVEQVKQERDFTLERLEYGTGLAIDYFAADADDQEAARLEAISGKIREVAKKIQLTVEMGRFFAAPCGYYFTRVMDVKTNMDVNYAIVDGGLNQLKYDGQIQGMQIPQITHLKAAPAETQSEPEKWTLCGSLCTTADVLVRKVPMNGLAQGDVLAFHNIGAYSVTEGPALFLSRNMPRIILKDENGARLVRDTIHSSSINQGNT